MRDVSVTRACLSQCSARWTQVEVILMPTKICSVPARALSDLRNESGGVEGSACFGCH